MNFKCLGSIKCFINLKEKMRTFVFTNFSWIFYAHFLDYDD